MKQVEQITDQGKVEIAQDARLHVSAIARILSKHFTLENTRNPFACRFEGFEFTLCIKQITYLGHPHPIFKKRIQIPRDWQPYLKKGALLAGIYQYKTNTIFVFFDTKKYQQNKLNNSSAHVHTLDIQKGLEYGIFEKIDSRGNKITVVTGEKLPEFMRNLLRQNIQSLPSEIKIFDDFSKNIDKKWNGVECYKEMFAANYRNKAQPEWPGFYLEFNFEKYLSNEPGLRKICNLVANKKDHELDFDLDFHGSYLGDLKMHSVESPSIPGNDKESFTKALNQYSKFWYVVFEHKTQKDKNLAHETTLFWNKLQNKEDLLSYANRMKHSIELTHLKILEINQYNLKYISDMTQGKNSNGKDRALKIQIHKKHIDNFLIFNKELSY